MSIPVRLGLNSIQPEYLDCLKKVFDIDETVGIAGGQEHRALYFVGILNPKSNDPKLIYLDPHFVQDAIPSVKATNWIKLIDDAENADGSDSDSADVN